MSDKQIKLRIFPDGRVEAEIEGMVGSQCLDMIPLVESLVGGEAIDSQRTESYYASNTLDETRSESVQVTNEGE